MPASRRVSRSKPTPVTRRPAKPAPSRRKAVSFWSMTATVWPWPSRIVRQRRAHPAAAHDDEVHAVLAGRWQSGLTLARHCRSGRARPRPVGQALASRDVPQVTDAAQAAPRSAAPCAATGCSETLLPKRIALPVFASDALSSVAYAPDEILLTLGIAGFSAYAYSWKVGLAVVVVMLVVVASYRQNVHAYPSGGGDYEVATVNLGADAGLDRRQRAARRLRPHRRRVDLVGRAVRRRPRSTSLAGPRGRRSRWSAIVLLMAVNLRGVRESGTAFAIPTYGFMVARPRDGGLSGFFRLRPRRPADAAERRASTLVAEAGTRTASPACAGAFLLLRAFSSGCAALTGVEAISNGVPAFQKPKSKNAATTLLLLGTIAVTMLSSIIVLAKVSGLRFAENVVEQLRLDGEHGVPLAGGRALPGRPDYVQDPVIGQLAEAVFGNVPLMAAVVTTVTALILVLAANTAFNGFPVLGSILAQDRYLPRQLHTRGDRLAFSNGIILLAGVRHRADRRASTPR